MAFMIRGSGWQSGISHIGVAEISTKEVYGDETNCK